MTNGLWWVDTRCGTTTCAGEVSLIASAETLLTSLNELSSFSMPMFKLVDTTGLPVTRVWEVVKTPPGR